MMLLLALHAVCGSSRAEVPELPNPPERPQTFDNVEQYIEYIDALNKYMTAIANARYGIKINAELFLIIKFSIWHVISVKQE